MLSPMNMGAWTLSEFSSFSAAAAFANLIPQKLGDSIAISIVENAAGTLAAATGLVMASYTGVLIGATVVPVWNQNVGTLPLHFAASGMNSAVSLLELIGAGETRATNLLGIGASAYEVYEGFELETRRDRINEPLHKGWSGAMVRAGGVLSGPWDCESHMRSAEREASKGLRRGRALRDHCSHATAESMPDAPRQETTAFLWHLVKTWRRSGRPARTGKTRVSF